MEHKFKIGDQIKIIKRDANNHTGVVDWNKPNGDVGKTGYVKEMEDSARPYCVYSGLLDGAYLGWFEESELTSDRKKSPAVATPIPKFILQYDGNRCEALPSEKQLRSRIDELSKEQVENRAFTVYDIKRTRTVTLGVKITIK